MLHRTLVAIAVTELLAPISNAQHGERGWTLEEARATADLTEDAGYEPIRFIVSLGLDRGFVLQRAWEEATGSFELVPAAREE